MPIASRRAPARSSRRPRRRRTPRLQSLLFDRAGMLRPLGELDRVLRQSRVSARVRVHVLRTAQGLWKDEALPQLASLRRNDSADAIVVEEVDNPS